MRTRNRERSNEARRQFAAKCVLLGICRECKAKKGPGATKAYCGDCARKMREKQQRRRDMASGVPRAELLALVGDRCMICKGPGTHVDHDHGCCVRGCRKCIRGLLCLRCNNGIGMLRENVELFLSAISYLMVMAPRTRYKLSGEHLPLNFTPQLCRGCWRHPSACVCVNLPTSEPA